jgi:glutathione S-transferase
MNYLTVEEAREATGLRLVLTAGVPGPWGESAKAIFAYKNIGFQPVYQEGGGANEALAEWTGQTSAPVAVLDDQPPVSHWLDLLHLAERIAPEPALIPEDAAARAEVLGLSALIAGVDGIGWNRRVQILDPVVRLDEVPEPMARIAGKYACTPEAMPIATRRLATICAHLDTVLERQQQAGSPYFVGDSVSAVDFYWANFAAMFKPLPHEVNPMPDYLRSSYASAPAETLAAFTGRLEAHRDLMYDQHIALPLDF